MTTITQVFFSGLNDIYVLNKDHFIVEINTELNEIKESQNVFNYINEKFEDITNYILTHFEEAEICLSLIDRILNLLETVNMNYVYQMKLKHMFSDFSYFKQLFVGEVGTSNYKSYGKFNQFV